MTLKERFTVIKKALQRELIIRRYMREKNYEQIYLEFGQKAYITHIPHKYKIKEIRKLKKEHNYELIRQKYGEKEYQKYISYVIKQDVLKETGSIHLAKKEQVKYVLNKFFTKSIPAITKGILVSSALVIALTPAAFGHFNQNIIAESTEVYAEQISDYNQNAIEYANKINQIAGENNFSDLDIIMKVVSDMWKEIDGYGEPELDAFGYYRLDIENGVGMCRHMADDIAYKLNEINPEYNARSICVYASDGEYYTSNIERTIINPETQVAVKETNVNEPIVVNNLGTKKEKIIGNHAVTVLDIDDVTLIVDPTNSLIGVLKNGQIKILNPTTGHYEFTYMGNSLLLGMETYEYEIKQLQSYLNFHSMEELTAKYGLEAQNESLAKIENINNTLIKK